MFGIDAGEFGNVMRDRAAVGARAHFIGDFGDDIVKMGHGVAHGASRPTFWVKAALESMRSDSRTPP